MQKRQLFIVLPLKNLVWCVGDMKNRPCMCVCVWPHAFICVVVPCNTPHGQSGETTGIVCCENGMDDRPVT